MSEPVFPSLRGEEWPVDREVLWSTLVDRAVSGFEVRTGLMPYPFYKWTVSWAILQQDTSFGEYAQILGLINQLFGRALTFLYSDFYDNAVTAQPIAIGDGTTTVFQLVRTFGGFTEPVYATNGTVNVFNNGTLVSSGLTVNAANGTITFAVAPIATHAITATFSYYWRCRLDADDGNVFSSFDAGGVEMKKFSFMSTRI